MTNYQLFTGDNVEIMRDSVPNNSIDLTVTSPPYDPVVYDGYGELLITLSGKGLRDYTGYTWDFSAVAHQLWRVTKKGGVVVWVVADATIKGSETGSSFRQALFFMNLGFNLHQTILYRMPGTGAKGSNLCYTPSFEYMFVFSKGKPKTINLIRDRINKHAGKSTSGQRSDKKGSTKGSLRTIPKFSKRTNIWKIQSDGLGIHPATFPEKLARDHIRSWSSEGDLVFDPFSGAGTTILSAVKLARHAIGIDCSPKYTELANERIQASRLPFLEKVKPNSIITNNKHVFFDDTKTGWQVSEYDPDLFIFSYKDGRIAKRTSTAVEMAEHNGNPPPF